MTTKKPDQKAADRKSEKTSKAIPDESDKIDTGLPGGGRGRVDVTGIVPEGIHVDPDLTEGHPGYQESGDSEIIPTRRFTRDDGAEENSSK